MRRIAAIHWRRPGIALAVVAAVALWGVYAEAQVFDTQSLGQETLWSDFFGVDARAMGMGNTGLALSRDGSALVYNPANLARVKRIELRAGLSHLRLTDDTRFLSPAPLDDNRNISKTRINALSLTVPVPSYRGSLVFGFGVHRVNSFDRTFGVVYSQDAGAADRGRELETGGIWKWTAAGALDISPRVSTGLSLHLLTGRDEYRWNRDTYTPSMDVTENQSINLDYVGAAATAGLSYAVSRTWSAGLTVETPTYLDVQEKASLVLDTSFSAYTWEFPSQSDYRIIRPFTFGLGLAGSFEHLNLAGDMHYADWSQLDFKYDNPGNDASLSADENAKQRFIQDSLTEVFSWHIGAEYLFPEQGLTLRAGYFVDPLPVRSSLVESQRKYFTAGVGLLVDRVMTIDVAYVHGGYKLRNDNPGTYFADYKTRRVFVTFGYRI